MLESQWQSMTGNLSSNRDGWVRLDDLCVLDFSGSDVRGFLQGYFTSDVLAITAEAYQPSAICNLQGRVTAFGWARALSDELMQWLVPDSVVAELRDFLKPYLAFSKTKLEPHSNDYLVLARVCEPGEGNIADAVALEIVDSDSKLETLLTEHGIGRRDDINLALIDAQTPWLTADVAGRFLPQMLGLVALGAVSFDKGCYLGQEVVARAQHRGQVKRQITVLTHDQPAAAGVGSEIIDANGRSCGVVINSAAAQGVAKSLCVLQSGAQSPYSVPDTGLTMLQ